MSISKPRPTNPCKKFIDYKGDKGQFFFYDKDLEQQIEIETPIYFVVLDELSTISGYNKMNDCGIYSNEVHRTTDEILKVKTFKGGESIIGLYQDIKDSVKAIGGKYTKSVYAMFVTKNAPELVNFKFKGSAFSAWLEKKMNTDNCVIGITEFVEETNGNIVYQVPVFKAFKLLPEINEQAIAMDKQLQEYLKEYKAIQPEKEVAKAEAVEEIQSNGKVISNSKEMIVNKSKSEQDEYGDLPWQMKDENPKF